MSRKTRIVKLGCLIMTNYAKGDLWPRGERSHYGYFHQYPHLHHLHPHYVGSISSGRHSRPRWLDRRRHQGMPRRHRAKSRRRCGICPEMGSWARPWSSHERDCQRHTGHWRPPRRQTPSDAWQRAGPEGVGQYVPRPLRSLPRGKGLCWQSPAPRMGALPPLGVEETLGFLPQRGWLRVPPTRRQACRVLRAYRERDALGRDDARILFLASRREVMGNRWATGRVQQ